MRRAVPTTVVALLCLLAAVGPASAVTLTDAAVTVTAVGVDETGRDGTATLQPTDSLVVAGVTNLRPEDHLIVVSVETRPGDVVAVAETATWGRDGAWVVDLEPVTLEPGAYVLEADAGAASDTVELTVTAPTPTPTEADTPTPTVTPTATPTSTATPTAAATRTTAPPATPASTTAAGPGLGALVALVVLGGAGYAVGRTSRRRR